MWDTLMFLGWTICTHTSKGTRSWWQAHCSRLATKGPLPMLTALLWHVAAQHNQEAQPGGTTRRHKGKASTRAAHPSLDHKHLDCIVDL
jgi:hypothetical protein